MELRVIDCPECGMLFGITPQLHNRRMGDGQSIHCPSGHKLSWGNNRESRLRQELSAERSARIAAEEKLNACQKKANRKPKRKQ